MTDERITELLNQWSASAANEGSTAFALVYDELRRIAAAYLRREPPGHVLQATGIVHEAFLRLSEQSGFEWRDRNHFFAFSSRIMRRVLVDEARRRKRAKRGGSAVHITLEDAEKLAAEPDVDVLRIDEALDEFAAVDRHKALVVELRFFAGLTLEETADTLGISLSTVNRQWRLAKLWLHERLSRG